MSKSVSLTIAIPIYNFDCRSLVRSLHQQALDLQKADPDFTFCICLADDCSTDPIGCDGLNEMATWSQVELFHTQQNIGRAFVLNRVLANLHSDYLLIVDADALVLHQNFLSTYWVQRYAADVLVGGIRTPQHVSKGCELRHRYECSAEHIRSLAYRRAHPARHFSTFNVWFNTKIFQVTEQGALRFDVRCVEYGYEDTLLGLELYRRGHSFLHLDNPLLHTGINPSAQFLRNTEAALRVLHSLAPALYQDSPILQLHHRLQQWHLTGIISQIFMFFRPLLWRHLCSAHPWLWLFSCYKIAYYCSFSRQQYKSLI